MRNIDGPATGLPNIRINSVPDNETKMGTNSDTTPNKNELIVMQQCRTEDLHLVRDALSLSDGDVDDAVIEVYARMEAIYQQDVQDSGKEEESLDPKKDTESIKGSDVENECKSARESVEKKELKPRAKKLTKSQKKRAKKEARKANKREEVNPPVEQFSKIHI